MNKNNYILIIATLLLIMSIFFINYNVKLKNENMGESQYVGTDDEYMISYNNLNKAACYVECAKNTDVGNECNYAITSGDLYKNGSCKLYNTINNSKHSPTDTLMYVTYKDIRGLNYVKNANKGYNYSASPIETYNNIHKLSCEYQCAFNNDCSSYTTNLDDDSLMAGTCTLYKESTPNNIINMQGTNLYTKSVNGVFFR
jgi:hypothetical protein